MAHSGAYANAATHAGPTLGIFPSLSLSLAASLFAFESPRLLDSRSRALKLRRQPNKLIRIVRARRTSRFCLPPPPSLPLSRASDLPAATLREQEKKKKKSNGGKKKRSKGVLLNGRLGTERKETVFLGGHRFLSVNPLSPYSATTFYGLVLTSLFGSREITSFCQRRVDKKGHTCRIPTSSKPYALSRAGPFGTLITRGFHR